MTEITKTQDQNVRKYSGSNKMPLSKLRSAQSKRPASPGRGGIILLADISGSMAGEKLDHLKKALNQVWQGREGLKCICFESDLWEIGIEDVPQLHSVGSTNMMSALGEAWQREAAHIVLLTDGHPDGGKHHILEAATLHTNTPIDTVGIGTLEGYGYDPDFLRELSALTNGRYTACNEPISLPNVIEDILLLAEKTERKGAIEL